MYFYLENVLNAIMKDVDITAQFATHNSKRHLLAMAKEARGGSLGHEKIGARLVSASTRIVLDEFEFHLDYFDRLYFHNLS